jgi:uncharacterized protein with HEPN domain
VSPRDWKERIQDILDAIAEIQAFTKHMDFEAFSADAKTLKAVELNSSLSARPQTRFLTS